MSKKVIVKLIVFSIFSLFSFSNVHASGVYDQIGTPEDIAYFFSYSMTIKAMNDNTQESINNAGFQIKKLKTTNARWAAGEFSKLLDEVEQSKINNCVKLINIAKASDNSDDIANARAALNELLTITENQQVLDYANMLNTKLKTIELK